MGPSPAKASQPELLSGPSYPKRDRLAIGREGSITMAIDFLKTTPLLELYSKVMGGEPGMN
jgi:hypothetical protein